MASKKRNASSSAFVDSIDVLLKTLEDIERKNVHMQKLCCARKSLFRPWPRKRDCDKDTAGKDGDNVQSNDQGQDTLTPAEKSEIALMDKMLNKAQKAMEVQQRIKESGRKQRPTQHKKHDNENTKPGSVKTQDLVKSDPVAPPINNLTRKPGNEKITNPGKGTNSKLLGDQFASKSVTTRQNPGQSLQGRSGGRGSSGAGMRGGKKVKAAHLTAPFQTNPRLAVPKRHVEKRISSGAKCKTVIPKSSSVVSKKSTISEQNSHIQKHTGKDDPKIVKDEDLPEETSDSMDEDRVCDDRMSAHNSSIESDHSKEQEEETPLVTKNSIEGSSVTQDLSNLKITADTDVKEKEDRFCLLTDGKKLSIPGKLRRLYANNVRLREKIKLQGITQKVDVCTSRQQFVSKVESMFELNEAQSVGRKVSVLTNIYTNLLQILSDLDLRDTANSWSCYDVLRAKNLVEFILTVFYKTEEERLKFNPDVLSGISSEGRQPRVTITSPEPSVTSQFWSPTFLKMDPYVYNVLSRPHSCLQYKNSKDLDRYMALVFQIQFEQLQLRLLETIATEVLPSLRCRNYKPGETVWIFRSLYSILTSNMSFPVIVKDTIQELEESPENT
ncbi:uncharacterized protein [Argopecten irradians]|uniref:uncharacterized protein n=1 Tax=Argopecten irradians TaxID=31199 RepID=UPI00371723FE